MKKNILFGGLLLFIFVFLFWFFFISFNGFGGSILVGKIQEKQNIREEEKIQEKVCTDVTFELSDFSCEILDTAGYISVRGVITNTGQNLPYLALDLAVSSGGGLLELEKNIENGEIRVLGPYPTPRYGLKSLDPSEVIGVRLTPVIYIEGEEQECQNNFIPLVCS